MLLDAATKLTAKIEAEKARSARTVAALERKRRSLWLRANRLGVTYDGIVEACGVSDGKLCQEIRRARAETADKALAAPLR